MPSYDVLVYRDLKTSKSYAVGAPVPELGEGLYVVAMAPPLHPRRATARRAWRNATARMGAGFAGSGLTWLPRLSAAFTPLGQWDFWSLPRGSSRMCAD